MTSSQLFEDFQLVMNNTVVMQDLRNLYYYFGLQFERDKKRLYKVHQQKYIEHQQKYIEQKLSEFRLNESK